MRVTTFMTQMNSMKYLGSHAENLNKLNTQLLTGKSILTASDDPISMTSILNNKRKLTNVEQYESNISTANSHLETTEGTLGEIGDIFTRVKELLTQASNDTYTQDELDAIATEISDLKEQVGLLANTKFGDFYIFGGTDISKPPYNKNTGAWEANPAANKPIEIEVSDGVFIPINTDGEEIFNGSGVSRDIFDLFDDIIMDLKSGNTESIRDNRLDEMNDAITQNLRSRSKLGSALNRLDIISSKNAELKINASEDLSNKQDVDVAELAIELTAARTVYQSALAVTGKLLQTSLINHLV